MYDEYAVYDWRKDVDEIPDDTKFGIGYPFLHNVYVKRNGVVNFSYHFAKNISCVNC